MLALVAVFLAAFFDYRPYLSPGERGTILVIAADRKQIAGDPPLHRRAAQRRAEVASLVREDSGRMISDALRPGTSSSDR